MIAATRQRAWLMPALVFLLAAGVYASAGFHNTLIRDGGGYLYAGQQVLKGVPPYQSIFTHKGPVAPLVVAAGVALSGPLGLEDVFAVRGLFYLIGCLTAAAVSLLAAELLHSRRVGLLAGLVFLSFYPFTQGATAGPEPKLPMLLFVMLSLYFTATRRWLWAGAAGSLAALTWQPTIIYPATTLLLALLQARPQRARAALLTIAGGAVPVLAIVAYFAERRALYDLVDHFILFNVAGLDRGVPSLLDYIRTPVQVVTASYYGMLVPIAIGFVAVAGLFVWRISRLWSWRDAVADPFTPLLLTFIPPLLWSFKDFQGAPDFYVFLPALTVGLGLWLETALRYVEGRASRPALGRALTAAVCAALIGMTVLSNLAQRDFELDRQLQAARDIEARFGPDVRVLARGRPYVLALLHKTSPTPIMNCNYVFDLEMSKFPGGFEEWMRQIEAFDPELVALGKSSGDYVDPFMAWLEARYTPRKFGPWRIYIKNTRLAGS